MKHQYDIHKGFTKTKTKTYLVIYSLIFGAVALLTAATFSLGAVHATSPKQTDLSSNNWRVFNGMPATNAFWDINKAQSDGSGGVQFPVQQFQSKTTGSFAIYLENNYNNDLTNKTITANANWTSGTYETRSTAFPGAYARLEFQDTSSGTYNSNDYWWSTGTSTPLALNLNTGNSGTLEASLSDCSLWTNQSGKSACDTTHNWVEWQGDTVAQSPAEGFANAMKNVKQVSVSFGSEGSYASGVALDGATGYFDMTSFTIQ